jgi:hypothetical protein
MVRSQPWNSKTLFRAKRKAFFGFVGKVLFETNSKALFRTKRKALFGFKAESMTIVVQQ